MRRHGAIHRPAPAAIPRLGAVAGLSRLAVPTHGSWTLARAPGGVANPPDGDALGNNDLGCCVPAADWRWIQAVLAARGRLIAIETAWVIARYEMTADYVPGNPATDEGTDTRRDMLNWVAAPIAIDAPGLALAMAVAWATIPPDADDEIAVALGQTPLLSTWMLPESRADDMASWAVPPDGEPGTLGHREPVLGFDGVERTTRSWGDDTVPPIHPEFWAKYCVAVDAPIPIIAGGDYDFPTMDYLALAARMLGVLGRTPT